MKRKLRKSKSLQVVSASLLISSATLSLQTLEPVVAKEATTSTETSVESEVVNVLASSAQETETTGSAVIASEEATKSETTDSTVSSSSQPELETESSQPTTSSSSETTSTTSSSETTSSSKPTPETSTSSQTTTSTQKEKPSVPNGSTTQSVAPNQEVPTGGTSNNVTTVGESSNNQSTPGLTNSGTTSSETETTFYISPNYTTKAFVKVIGEDARKIAGSNDVYASVMIAQAILESASGNSGLASAPNYNLFGIKGNYKGASTNFLTSEDNGSGSMYTIRSDFRKYPSYKESLEDYVKLIRGGVDFSNSFYSGTWKSKTTSYKDATKFLTGRYATDTNYYAKLNALIEAYKLTEYDVAKTETTQTTSSKKTTTNDKKTAEKTTVNTKKTEFLSHVVKKGESLKTISDLYDISVLAILEKNQMERRMLVIGQTLIIPNQENEALLMKEDALDRSFATAEKISSAFRKVKKTETTQSSDFQVTAARTKTKQVYEVRKGDSLASISKKTGVSIRSLKEFNQLDQYILTEGQQLVLVSNYYA